METLTHCDTEVLLVEDLLDFSCGDIGGLCEDGDDVCTPTISGQDQMQESVETAASRPSARELSEASEPLYSPPDELAELEWLSSFVEESYTSPDHSNLSKWFKANSSRDNVEKVGDTCLDRGRWLRMNHSGTLLDMGGSPLIETTRLTSSCNSWEAPPSFSLPKGRSRSKRARSGGRIWSLHTLKPINHKRPAVKEEEEEEEEEEEDLVSSLDFEPYYNYHLYLQQKQRKKTKKPTAGGPSSEEQQGRRCSHCQVSKTPQWRAGPMGPKTLCNACGVRYKSGRLVPEYRPAASPTFVTELHSNSHKKILEMRFVKSRFADHEELSSCSQESTSTSQDRA